MQDWFKDWFAAEEYIELYSNRDYREAEKIANLIINFCDNRQIEIRNMLDVACGYGRHSIYFAKKIKYVFAFDLSFNLIKIALTNKHKFNLQNLHYFVADMAKLPLKQKFDLITNLFTSFGYYLKDKDNFQILKNINLVLKKGGIFVFDYFNSFFLAKNLVEFEEKIIGEKKFRIRRYIINDRVIKEIEIFADDKIKRYVESVKLYSKENIEKMFCDCGFQILSEYGDYDGNSFDINKSERLIIFAKKNV